MNAHVKILKRHHAFSSLSNAILRRLAANASIEQVGKGKEIYREGEPCVAMYVLLSGRCQSVIGFEDGTEHELNVYLPGDTFGEGAIMSRDTYWTTIRVLTDSTLLRISGDDVVVALAKDAQLREHFYRMLQRSRSSLRNRPSLSSLGRVVTVLYLSPYLDSLLLTEQVGRMLRKDINRSVLIIRLRVSPDDKRPYLSLKKGFKEIEELVDLNFEDLPVERIASGIRSMVIQQDLDDPAPAISRLVSIVSSLFRYVLISMPTHAAPSLVQACVRQSDHSFAFLLPGEQSERRLKVWLSEIESDDLTPVVCREDNKRSPETAIGLRAHRSLELDPEHPNHSKALLGVSRFISRSRVGLALSSGGAKSLAHVGVLQALEEQGLEPDCAAGSSMGACIAALWASGMPLADIEALAMKLERRFSMLRMVDPVFPPRRGFMKGRAIYRWLKDILGPLRFEDLPRKLYVVITDMETLEKVVVTSGPILPAIHASMAMPGVIVPPKFRGRYSFDGSIADPLPVSVLQDDGVEHVIAVNTIPSPDDLKECSLPVEETVHGQEKKGFLRSHLDYFAPGNLLDIFMRSMHGAQTRVAEGACSRADVTIRPVSCDGAWHDFSQPRKYLELGREAAQKQAAAIKNLENSR